MSAWMYRAMRLIAVLVLSACLGSCSDSPSSPSRATTLSGTWVSTDRTFTWILAQSGSTVTGSHVPTDGQPAVPIAGTFTGSEFSFRVITGERLVTFLDPPQVTEVGWGARVDVNGEQMTGSISSIGSAFRYNFHEITLRRVDAGR